MAAPNGITYSGTSWTRSGRKVRRDGEVPTIPLSAGEECDGEVAPDAIVLDDGYMYDVTGMSDELFGTLYDLAVMGTTHAALPSICASHGVENDAASVEARLQEMEEEIEE